MDGNNYKISWYLGGHSYFKTTLREVRLAWTLVSENPRISRQKLADQLNTSKTRAWGIVNFLQACGYIKQHGKTAIKIIIPCVPMEATNVQ